MLPIYGSATVTKITRRRRYDGVRREENKPWLPRDVDLSDVPMYAFYQSRTERRIPVVVLERD